MPSDDPRLRTRPKALGASAPLVTQAAAGAAVAVNEYGTTHALVAPSPFNATLVVTTTDGTGAPIEIHVLPVTAPTVPSAARLASVGLEDVALPIQLWVLGSLTRTTAFRIAALPAHGTLYDIGADSSSRDTSVPITAAGQMLSTTQTPYVLYMPSTHAFGAPLDTFSYVASSGGPDSAAANVSITVEGANDRPSVSSATMTLIEDGHPEGVLVHLNASDAETGLPLEFMITRRPAKGRLYLSADGTLQGARTLIAADYNLFELGEETRAQYLERVVAVTAEGVERGAGRYPIARLIAAEPH